MAPPTLQLMQWKESGASDKLFVQPCSSVVAPQIRELLAESFFHVKHFGVSMEVEEMRQDGQEAQRDMSAITPENISVVDSRSTLSELTTLI
ncbi:hypothetical protein INR49_003509 [Caranx melampygus]|nr:hypothetical protein INR49_003509 [Caranx melampygus]